jgi:hypothetical protein
VVDRAVSIGKCLVKLLMKAAAQGAEKNYERERSMFSEDRVGGISIYGDPPFVADVKEALFQLKEAYPHGYSLVQRYIRGIIQSTTNPDRGVANGVIYRKPNRHKKLGVPPNCFAAALVRRAAAIRKLLSYQIWRSRRSALASLNRELHAIRLLNCDSMYFQQQLKKVFEIERQLRIRKKATNG